MSEIKNYYYYYYYYYMFSDVLKSRKLLTFDCFSRDLVSFSFKMENTCIPNVTDCRYLGITISVKNCDLDLKRQKRRFYANTNMLLRKL